MSLKEMNRNLKVLILCGGKGERLHPLTYRTPKPLIKIKGTPILTFLINQLETFGFNKFVIAVGYKSDQIIKYFNHNHKNIEIEFVDSGDVDIMTRIQNAIKLIPDDFIVCYGDTLADVDLFQLIKFHHTHQGSMTVTSYPLQCQFGLLGTDESGKVISFAEKPVLDEWINIGYFYFNKESIKYIENGLTFVDFLNEMIERDNIFSFRHTGTHITVNTITELREAEKNITKYERNKLLH